MFRRALSGGPLAGAGRGRGPCSLLLAAIATATLLALETPPSFLQAWGSFGSGPGQLNTPVGIAIDQAGEMTLLIRASRAYEANLAALSIERQMYARALELGRA